MRGVKIKGNKVEEEIIKFEVRPMCPCHSNICKRIKNMNYTVNLEIVLKQQEYLL